MAMYSISPANKLPKEKLSMINNILARVLNEVKPTEKERKIMTAYANDIISRLKAITPREVEIISAGSVARGTQMRGTSDIDIFLLFPRTSKEEDMERKGLELAKRVVAKHKNESYIIKYAEHPYVKLVLNDVGVTADIVPAFKINHSRERITAVDRTQLHNIFINTNMTPKQKDDVILLKAFFKAHNIYGAGAKFEGFSGYLCELLICTFGSFTDTIVNLSRLKQPIALFPKDRTIVHDTDNVRSIAKKFNKGFIVIDPTDDERNVAAVVSEEALARATVVSRLFLDRPTIKMFYGPKFSDIYSERKVMRLRKELGLDVYLLSIKVPEIAEDILWQQARRFEGRIDNTLKENGFAPIISFEEVQGKELIIAFLVPNVSISHSVIDGPSAYMGNAVGEFISVHSESLGIVFNGEKLVSLEEARFKKPREVIEHAISTTDLPSYIKKDNMRLYVNKMPEGLAKMFYAAFVRKTSI